MNKSRLLIIGAGGHGRVVADAAEASGDWKSIAFIDDRFPEVESSDSWQVIGRVTDLPSLLENWDALVVAVGDNSLRIKLQQEALSMGYAVTSIIHPSAYIGKGVEIGEGSVVFAKAVINTGSRLGKAVIVNTAATIDHDGVIGDGVHISPGAHLAGNVHVGDFTWIGIGAAVINQINIGSSAIVGAGAVVIKDVGSGKKVVGVPAVDLEK